MVRRVARAGASTDIRRRTRREQAEKEERLQRERKERSLERESQAVAGSSDGESYDEQEPFLIHQWPLPIPA